MFFGRQPDSAYNFDEESYRMSHELVGVVAWIDGGMAQIELRNRLDRGDPIEFLSPGLGEKFFAVESMRDPDGADVQSARNGDVVFIRVPEGVRIDDLVRRPKDFREKRYPAATAREHTIVSEGFG
jgi:putative protease